jgi:hypothetical protein
MADWYAHPKQWEALQRTETEILFGGSRGGGKTDAGLVFLTKHIDNPNYRALVIRKNADDLADWTDRAVHFYSGLGAQIAYRPAVVKFPSGAVIHTGHLKDDQAYTKYQGQEYQIILIEEITQIPELKRYLQLMGSLRSTIPSIKPQMFATTNPGGLGHVWVKQRFIDPAPPGISFIGDDHRSRIYIPATIDDNPTLALNDPGYIEFLEGLKETDVDLWKAWRLGDWNTFAGQYFKEWRKDLHEIKPFIPYKSDDRIFVGGMDWGRTDMFITSFDVIEKVYCGEGEDMVNFFRSRTFCEVAGTEKKPSEWGEAIVKKLDTFKKTLDDIEWIRCDNQIFNKGNDNSKSIYDQFIDYDERFRTLLKPASKDRVPGWENLHNWLSIAPDGEPYWQVAENCNETIVSMTSLVHDENLVEDVDSSGNDHGADAQRYEKKHLKWIDARVGAVLTDNPKDKLPETAHMVDGGQAPIDLKAFETGGHSEHIIRR